MDHTGTPFGPTVFVLTATASECVKKKMLLGIPGDVLRIIDGFVAHRNLSHVNSLLSPGYISAVKYTLLVGYAAVPPSAYHLGTRVFFSKHTLFTTPLSIGRGSPPPGSHRSRECKIINDIFML